MAEKVMDSLVDRILELESMTETISANNRRFIAIGDKIDRMIKTSSHGCFHIGPISMSQSSSALGYCLGLIIDARP